MNSVDNNDAVPVDNSVQLTAQEKDSVNYILVIKDNCNKTNALLNPAHPDIKFICETMRGMPNAGEITNNISTTFTALTNLNEQRSTDGRTKISLEKIKQLPNYTYHPVQGFQPMGTLCTDKVCLINRNDMKTTLLGQSILNWVKPQPKLSDEDIKNYFEQIKTEYGRFTLNYTKGIGGKRSRKRPNRKRKPTKRRRGTRKRTNKKR